MISTELLSQVLGYKVESVTTVNSRDIKQLLVLGEKTVEINVYELAFKCKEWAESNGYVLESSTFNLEGFCSIKWIGSGRLKSIPWEPQPSSTEYEAIFRACQWILDNK